MPPLASMALCIIVAIAAMVGWYTVPHSSRAASRSHFKLSA